MARKKRTRRPVRGLARAVERGRRVFLRKPLAGDRREYLAVLRASADFHRPWNSLPPEGEDPFSDEAFRRALGRADREDRKTLFVCRRTDGAFLGVVTFSQIFRGAFQNAYLGYWIGAEYAGKGYMREAVRLALRHAFTTLELHRVEANIMPGNAASLALAKGAGLRREGYSPRYLHIAGRWEDHESWAITVEDWRR